MYMYIGRHAVPSGSWSCSAMDIHVHPCTSPMLAHVHGTCQGVYCNAPHYNSVLYTLYHLVMSHVANNILIAKYQNVACYNLSGPSFPCYTTGLSYIASKQPDFFTCQLMYIYSQACSSSSGSQSCPAYALDVHVHVYM